MKRTIFAAILLATTPLIADAQRLEAASSVVDCGQVLYQNPVTAEFQLRNATTRPMYIATVDAGCGCIKVDYPTSQIRANETFKVWVTYNAERMGHFDRFIDIYPAGDDEATVLHLKGVVVDEVVDFSGDYPYQVGTLLADINALDFADLRLGDQSQRHIHIRNTTSTTLEPVVMHLPNYLRADVSPSKIVPGKGATITVTFDARAVSAVGLVQTKVYLGDHPGDKVAADNAIDVAAVILPRQEYLTEDELAFAPHISLSTEELQLGAFNGKKKIRGTMYVKNTGLSDLRIEAMQMLAPGLQLSLSSAVIRPDDVAELKVVAERKLIVGAADSQQILLVSNDPEQPKTVVSVVIDDI